MRQGLAAGLKAGSDEVGGPIIAVDPSDGDGRDRSDKARFKMSVAHRLAQPSRWGALMGVSEREADGRQGGRNPGRGGTPSEAGPVRFQDDERNAESSREG